jgi:hypothetical protein
MNGDRSAWEGPSMPSGIGPAAPSMTWSVASGRAAVMLLASVLLLVVVPDRLLAYLSTRIVPGWRDFLMVLYIAAAFVVTCWLFVRLQRERHR